LGLNAGDEVKINEEPDGSLRIQNRRAAAYSLIGLAGTLDRTVLADLAADRQVQAQAEDDAARPHDSASASASTVSDR
jgi:hypothetical protein